MVNVWPSADTVRVEVSTTSPITLPLRSVVRASIRLIATVHRNEFEIGTSLLSNFATYSTRSVLPLAMKVSVMCLSPLSVHSNIVYRFSGMLPLNSDFARSSVHRPTSGSSFVWAPALAVVNAIANIASAATLPHRHIVRLQLLACSLQFLTFGF